MRWDSPAPLITDIITAAVLATSVISGRVPTYDSSHSWWLFTVVPLHHDLISTQLHYPDNEWGNQSLPSPNNAERPGSNPWAPNLRTSKTGDGLSTHSAIPSGLGDQETIWGGGADGLVSQWGSTIKLPWGHTVRSQSYRYPSWYDLRCCQDKSPTTNQLFLGNEMNTFICGLFEDVIFLRARIWPKQSVFTAFDWQFVDTLIFFTCPILVLLLDCIYTFYLGNDNLTKAPVSWPHSLFMLLCCFSSSWK